MDLEWFGFSKFNSELGATPLDLIRENSMEKKGVMEMCY